MISVFTDMLFPTKEEIEKENCVDGLYNVYTLNIPKASIFFGSYNFLINDAIINYKNEVIVAKFYYACIVKYYEAYKKNKCENYEFWLRKYIEQEIKELYSIYDKSMHIINRLYNFNLRPDFHFKETIREKLKKVDKKKYRKINSVFSRLYGDDYKYILRDDITHNISSMFDKLNPVYNNGIVDSWKKENAITIGKSLEIIKEICSLLAENINIINDMLKEKFSSKIASEQKKENQNNSN